MGSNWETHGYIRLMLVIRLFGLESSIDCPLIYFDVSLPVSRVGSPVSSVATSEAQAM